jgi:hypothetical protein
MSVPHTSNIPANPVSIPADANTPAPGAAPADTPDTTEGAGSSSTAGVNFFDEQQRFEAGRQHQRRRMDQTIGEMGTRTPGAEGTEEGDKAASGAFNAAGVPLPPKSTIGRARTATRDNPGMEQLHETFAKAVQSGDPSGYVTPMVHQALGVAESSGLLGGAGDEASHAAGTGGAPVGGGNGSGSNSAPQAPTGIVRHAVASSPNAGGAVDPNGTSTPTTGANGIKNNAQTPAPVNSVAYQMQHGGQPLVTTSIMAIVFTVMAQSLDADNKNKRVQLKTMQMYNQMGKLVSDYLATLQTAQASLDKKTAGKKPSQTKNASVLVDVMKNVDTDHLYMDGQGKPVLGHTMETQRLQAAGLSAEMTTAQGNATSVSNNSEQASNRYQGEDKRSTTTFGTMTTIIKVLMETATSVLNNYPK